MAKSRVHHPCGELGRDDPADRGARAQGPRPAVGEIAKDAVSGEALMTIGVVYIEQGESSRNR
jgi:hypothetical protein